MSLIESAQKFLDATKDECFQPGQSKDIARENLINALKEYQDTNIESSIEITRSSELLSTLQSMIDNPPGLAGVETDDGTTLGNSHIDIGWKAAVRKVISIIESEYEVID